MNPAKDSNINSEDNNNVNKILKSPTTSICSTSSSDDSTVSDSINESNLVHAPNGGALADDEAPSGVESSPAPISPDEKPNSSRKLLRKSSSDGSGVRKRSANNLFHKSSRAFSDSHDSCRKTTVASGSLSHDDGKSKPYVNVRHLDPSAGFGLRKQLLLARRSPSPCRYSNFGTLNSPSMCPGYVQYQLSLLEVPLPKDYGDASSDDLSSEWDSDVPEPQRSPKVFFLFVTKYIH